MNPKWSLHINWAEQRFFAHCWTHGGSERVVPEDGMKNLSLCHSPFPMYIITWIFISPLRWTMQWINNSKHTVILGSERKYFLGSSVFQSSQTVVSNLGSYCLNWRQSVNLSPCLWIWCYLQVNGVRIALKCRTSHASEYCLLWGKLTHLITEVISD
jgi:hypothetical protein